MRPGPKPKPAALARLHGQPSHVAKATVAARGASEGGRAGAMLPPADLSNMQAEIWVTAVRDAPPGVLRRSDSEALRVFVVAADLHRQACAALAGGELLVNVAAESARPVWQQNPALAILNRQGTIMLRAAEHLGFTPSSRPRLAPGALPPPSLSPPPPGTRKPRVARSLATFLADPPPRLKH